MAFGVRPDYVENPTPAYFVDDPTATRGIVFQPDVYTLAELLTELDDPHGQRILDVGCGWGDKLAAIHDRHPDWDLVGVDHGVNIERCRATYGWGTWVEIDLESVGPRRLQTITDKAIVGCTIVCADVIEHLRDPARLVRALAGSQAKVIVLSTPEREIEHGLDHLGPSPNPCHVREWSAVELRAFLESEGLRVRHVGLTRGNDQGTAMATTLVVAQT